MADNDFAQELERRKRASTAQLLFQAARRLNEHALGRVRAETGRSNLRPAHTQLFAHIDLDGTRLTELATRVGVTKQAVAQLVDELESMGTLERRPDPDDRRAKRIAFSEQGRRNLLHGLGLLDLIEVDLASALGARRVRELNRTLLAVLETLDRWQDDGA